MNYSGAVFFDYDGTLSDELCDIYYPTEKTIKTLNTLRKKGYFVCLATGRAKCYAPELSFEFDGYITSNGASAEINGKNIHSISFSPALLKETTKYFEKHGLYYSAENQESCYALDADAKIFRDIIDNFNIPREIFRPFSEIDENSVSKMLMVYPDEKAFLDAKAHFDGTLKLDKHRFCPSCDVTLWNVTKGTGVKKILDLIKVPFENTYAFGDGTNDIDMMRYVKHSVAMGISSDELKKVCESVTDSVKNEGVTKYFENIGLI